MGSQEEYEATKRERIRREVRREVETELRNEWEHNGPLLFERLVVAVERIAEAMAVKS